MQENLSELDRSGTVWPQVGMLATVRNRRAIISSVEPYDASPGGRIDPLYRSYGKAEALGRPREYFTHNGEVELEWLAYRARFKALSNWAKYAGHPFGDRITVDANGRESYDFPLSAAVHEIWEWRSRYRGFAPPEHPFEHQGSADINTWALGRDGGQVGMLVPSGLYSDKSAGNLRTLFRDRCRWSHLYVFQNERFVFQTIDHRFKIAATAVEKGGSTNELRARFRLGPGDSPELPELEDDVPKGEYLPPGADRIRRFSPNTAAILEVRSRRDLEILEKLYANGVLLGDSGEQGWGIRYVHEFDMTNDAALFPPRGKWDDQGYRPDGYGHWLKGGWRPFRGARGPGTVLSADGAAAIALDDVEDVALPLCQGSMIHQFDFCAAGYRGHAGARGFKWEPLGWDEKRFEPEYMVGRETYFGAEGVGRGVPLTFRDVARTTDARTMICALTLRMPCCNKTPILDASFTLCSILNSAVFDWLQRTRQGASSLNWFIVSEQVGPPSSAVPPTLDRLTAALSFPHPIFAREWLPYAGSTPWRSRWATYPQQRNRLRGALDAIVAELFALTEEEFTWILGDCGHPVEKLASKPFPRTLDPKGFWRVEKDKEPGQRYAVIVQHAFTRLKQFGLEAFLDEVCAFPESDRTESAADSWAQCRMHADHLDRINSYPQLESAEPPEPALATDLFDNPLPTDLFGNVDESGKRRR